MIVLYGYPQSRSLRAVWALEEAQAEYEYRKVDLLKGEGRTPSYLGVNPGGKVPALAEDGFVLTESAAIVTYIGERFGHSRLTPQAGTRDRAHYDQWCFFVIGELEQPLWTMAKHRFALPKDWRMPAIIETAGKEFEKALKILESGLGDKPYILGEEFSGADILVSHTLAWGVKAGHPPAAQTLLSYLERTRARPALARAIEREAGRAGPA